MVKKRGKEEELLLVYEYMKNGTPYDHLHLKNGEESSALNSWKMRITDRLNVARGIELLYIFVAPRIIHRDIRSLNFLLNANWVACVSSFSFSGLESKGELRAPSTVGYMDLKTTISTSKATSTALASWCSKSSPVDRPWNITTGTDQHCRICRAFH
ncbi:putative serine/threonine-protein kinase-like protein CCR3 [Zingiber officinale]|nr:putative serine/threonine-protein kinase-like protein CCR3 [Zingiber officinale]